MDACVVALHSERRHYAFALWCAATQGYQRLLAIETTEAQYAHEVRHKYGVPVVLFNAVEHPRRQGRHRICGPLYNQGWEALLEACEAEYILCLDTDVIPAGDILALMQEHADGVDFVRHGVPWRKAYHRPGCAYETSCTYGSKRAWRAALDKTYTRGELATLYGTVGDPDLFTHKDIDIMHLDHLESPLPERKDVGL